MKDQEPERFFSRSYISLQARGAERDGDFSAEFRSFGKGVHRSKMTTVDSAQMRVIEVWDQGGAEMTGAVADDALVAAFLWGDGVEVDGIRHDVPRLMVLGPGTQIRSRQPGEHRYLRIGIRGLALEALLHGRPRGDVALTLLAPGAHRPRVAAAAERRLQERIRLTSAFAVLSARRGQDNRAAMAVAVREAGGALSELLAVPAARPRMDAAYDRRRLVANAVDLLCANPDEPVSVAGVCETLEVGERALQRAFAETIGVGPRAYERDRRLRAVHGAIVAEGDRRSITDIAMSFGFWHLGRFSATYAKLYGCSPSATRHRFWTEPTFDDASQARPETGRRRIDERFMANG